MALVRNMIELDGKFSLCFEWPASNIQMGSNAADPAHHHVPHLDSMDAIMDVVTASLIGIFINVLDFETYCSPIPEEVTSEEERRWFIQNDINAMSKIDRMACTYVRGLSWSLLNWLEETFIFSQNGLEVDFVDLTNTLLVDLCTTLWRYKAQALYQTDQGVTTCNLYSLNCQLEGLFNEETQAKSQFKNELERLDDKAMDYDTSRFTVERREAPLSSKHDFSVESMMRLGLNPSDRLYYSSIYGDIDSMFKDINETDEGEHYPQTCAIVTFDDTERYSREREERET